MLSTRNALVAALISLSFLTPGAQAQCPDASQHETAQDCPWAQASRDSNGVTDSVKLRAILDQDIPGFMAEMERDGKSPALLDLWGLSRNIDESNLLTGTLTVPANLVQFFVSLWKVPYRSDSTVGHAGLNHTYGYLFSNAWTPYGYKRARYVQGELESGFGLTPGLLSGLPPEGTLLSNLTSFAGRIAFQNDRMQLEAMDEAVVAGQIVAVPEILKYPFASLHSKRLVEIAKGKDFYLELRTDIVDFPKTNTKGSDTSLLVYSLDFHAPGEPAKPRLITAFPVQTSFAAGIFNPSTLGEQKPLKLNYNAAVPVTIPAESMVGKRFIANESCHSTRN